MSAKLAGPGLLKITNFRNKFYDVITQIYDDVINKTKIILSIWPYMTKVW